MHAVRNIALCTKDCMCLFVCPTGATDTETGQIDAAKCIDGCRLCVDACPSHDIHLTYDTYHQKPDKDGQVRDALTTVLEYKVKQEAVATALAGQGGARSKVAKALDLSNRILGEDGASESNYMLPQSNHVRDLLATLLKNNTDGDFPAAAVKELLELL